MAKHPAPTQQPAGHPGGTHHGDTPLADTKQMSLVDPRFRKVEWDDETQDIIDFGDLTPWERKIRVGKDVFIVREASTEAGVKYRNKAAQAAKFSEEGKVTGVDNPADPEPYLVHLCLFYMRPDPKAPQSGELVEANVPLDRIRSWKYSVVKQLFDRIAKISGLREEDEDEALLTKRIAEDTKKLAQLRNGKKDNPPNPQGNDVKN